MTKLSLSTIYWVIKEENVIDHSFERKGTARKFKQIDAGDIDVIRRVIYNFSKENTVPILEIIREKLKDYSHYKYNCLANYTPCSRGKRIIILRAGSENGFVPNGLLFSAKNISQSSADYHEDMTAQLLEKCTIE
ncbi:uncharacterized protein [Euwallacea fornicatus]|uniref:uncharacterized protein n=1 Tax=Euwallacea fornicatus TaxID=995702 RepID=UPI00339055C2